MRKREARKSGDSRHVGQNDGRGTNDEGRETMREKECLRRHGFFDTSQETCATLVGLFLVAEEEGADDGEEKQGDGVEVYSCAGLLRRFAPRNDGGVCRHGFGIGLRRGYACNDGRG